VNIEEAASALSVSPSTILRMLNEGSLPGKQLCKGAPWIIRKEDIEHSDVCKKAEYRRGRGRRPSSQHLDQETLGF
jgi:excisionase family DNA binding protein